MKHNLYLSVLLFVLSISSYSHNSYFSDKNEVIFNRYVNYITPYKEAPFEIVLEQTAIFFLGTPYVAGTLDENDKEQLVVNLKELDCVTFVENVMALSYTAVSGNISFEQFKKQLQNIRYYKENIENYASRIHYTSDWICVNEAKGLLKDISEQLSGVKETKEINFMSSHRSAYKHLSDDKRYEEIKSIERNINKRGGFYYLPKENIASKAKGIPHMAVVAFVTSIEGLDTSHIGFAYQKNGQLLFIHASSIKKEVLVDSKTLSDYCISQKSIKGVIIAKLLSQK